MQNVTIDDTPVDVIQRGTGPHLLLLHSLLADRSSFDLIAPALAQRYRVTLPNLPGYGGTAPLRPPVTVEDYAHWVTQVIATLDLPASTAVLGNGLGGFTAVALAARHGHLFGKLLVVDALAGFPPAGKEPLRSLAARVQSAGMAAAVEPAIRRMFPEHYSNAHPALMAERQHALAAADANAFRHACLALAAADLMPSLGLIRNPALVIAGADDLTTPAALARELAAGIAGARYAEIADCGHCPQIQQPRALIALITDFLDA